MDRLIEKPVNKGVGIVRVVFEFYPLSGGSVTHTIELSEKIDQYLKNQIIIAPYFGKKDIEFDKRFKIPIIRVNFIASGFFHKFESLARVFSAVFVINTVKKIKELNRNKEIDIIHVHECIIGLLIILFKKMYGIKIPVVIMQHGNPKKRSKRSYFWGYLTFYYILSNQIFL